MDSKDITEIKKRFKKNETTITKIYSIYIDNEGNEICNRYENLLIMKDENENDFYKFLDLQKKTLSCKSIDLDFNSEESKDIKKLITSMYKDKLSNLEIIKIFIDELKKAYLNEIKGNFLITLVVDSYDVPSKTTDGFKVDESEEVYSYMICSVCPVTTSKAGLGYIEQNNTIGSRYQDWIVNPPELGFIYPSFTNRSSDNSTITYFYKNPKKLYESVISDFLKCKLGEETDIDKNNLLNNNEEIETKLIEENNKTFINHNSKLLNEEKIEEKKLLNEEIQNIEEPLNISNESFNEFLIENKEKIEQVIPKNPSITTEEILEEPFLEDNIEKSNEEEFNKFMNKINLLLDENKGKAEIQIINGKKFLLIPME